MVERDRFLTEQMGECWHETEGYLKQLYPNEYTNPDFSTWEGFGKLWEWSQKQEWWTGFISKYGKLSCDCGCNDGYMALHFITPNGNYNFPDTVYEYLKDIEK